MQCINLAETQIPPQKAVLLFITIINPCPLANDFQNIEANGGNCS